VLLFWHEDVIRSCTANYVTDAIYRRENTDRYDDRLLVTTNLIDAYEQLIEFIGKHTLDKFFLIADQSVSIRSKIARELVSNILVHREYTSAYPAKIIIERSRIITENWNLPKNHGHIDPDSFTPYPKNPLLANFFINIGRADVLGSGVRNLYRFTKMYSDDEPEFIDGDVFRTIVPLTLSKFAVSDNVSDNVGDNVGDNMSDKTHREILLTYLSKNKEVTATKAAEIIARSPTTARRVLSKFVIDGLVIRAGTNKNRKFKSIMPPDSSKIGVSDNVSDKTHHEVLLAYLSKNGEITATKAAEVIARSPATARRVLSELVSDDLVVAIGANKNRKYKAKK
jgi:ATP-dependent DNA helicase RecG